jgi:hypothetical protein
MSTSDSGHKRTHNPRLLRFISTIPAAKSGKAVRVKFVLLLFSDRDLDLNM